MVIEDKFLQFKNAFSGIEVIDEGSITVFKLMQPEKTSDPIKETEVGIVIEVKFEHP